MHFDWGTVFLPPSILQSAGVVHILPIPLMFLYVSYMQKICIYVSYMTFIWLAAFGLWYSMVHICFIYDLEILCVSYMIL